MVQVFKWEAPPGGSNGYDDIHGDAVLGGRRVLCSIPGGSRRGMQDSLAFATGRACVPPKPRRNPATAGTHNPVDRAAWERIRREPLSDASGTLGNINDRRKGISDVDSRSISGTIGETLPLLSPRTWAGFWLYEQLDTRVMGAGITARKESHGGSCTPRDIGSGFDSNRTRRPETLFCKAGGGRMGLLAESTSAVISLR